MNAPAETAPAPATNPAYLHVLEALVSLNEPADRERIATKAGISPDGAGVQLVALAGKRIVVRCPQPKGAPALWSLAVPLSTARQMVAGMKRAAAEASPAADDRRRIIAAMREIGAPASAFGIAKKSGVEMPNFSLFLEEMAADGVIQRIGGTSGQRPKFALIPSVQSQTPTATDGTPGDGEPAPEPDDTQAVEAAEPTLMSDTAELQPSVEPVEPVAETPAAEADADGWIPWNGGECPVPVGSRCSIKIRDGRVTHCIRNPEAWWWGRVAERTTDPGDIVDYRPEPELPGVDDTEEALARRQIDLARELMADGCQPSEIDDPDDPDDYGDDEIQPAAAYDATVEAEAKADEAPLAGEDVNGEADVLKDRCERYTDPVEAAADQIAAAVAAGQCPTVGMLFGGSGPGVVYGPIKQSPSAALDPLLHRASPVTEEAAQRAIDTAEVEALMREKEADIALEMARDARVRGRAVAELIRFAEQRTGLAGDADPDAVLAAIVELLDGARSAVTGMSRPA